MNIKSDIIGAGIIIIIILAFITAILYFSIQLIDKFQNEPIVIQPLTSHSDTTYIEHKTDTVIINKLKTIYRNSILPIYIDSSFTKTIDTSLSDAHLHLDYYFPEDSVNMIYIPPKERFIHTIDTLIISKPYWQYDTLKVENKSIMPYIYGGLGGVLVGIVVDAIWLR